jgi:hypothetical protein
MSVKGVGEQIKQAVLSWPDVTAEPHRFGGTEFRIDRRELGHIHGDSLVDIPFPTKARNRIVESGRAQPHHILPESGWIGFYLHEEADIQNAIELLHLSYEIALKQKSRSQVSEESDLSMEETT